MWHRPNDHFGQADKQGVKVERERRVERATFVIDLVDPGFGGARVDAIHSLSPLQRVFASVAEQPIEALAPVQGIVSR